MPDVQNQTASRPPWLPYRVKRPFSPGALTPRGRARRHGRRGGLVAALMGIAILATVFLVTYPPLYRRYIASSVSFGVYSPSW